MMAETEVTTEQRGGTALHRMADVLIAESNAIAALRDRIDVSAEQAIATLKNCSGRVIVSGLGKSGLIGQKIAATFCSTGTAAVFLHAAEAFHGDFGVIGSGDVVIALSSSGETQEVVDLAPHARRLGAKVIGLTRLQSPLGQASDICIDIDVAEEADPLGLAPMAQTTAMLAMGDALAAALHESKGFSVDRFAQLHPGGALGKRLLSTVEELMHPLESLPLVHESTLIRDALVTMSEKRLGALFVVNEPAGPLLGIFTDGDLRRQLEHGQDPLDRRLAEVMTSCPQTASQHELAIEATRHMQSAEITVLPVVDEEGCPVGALHLHDLIAAGLS